MMSDSVLSFPEPRTEDEYRAAIEWLLAEMQRINQQMKDDQDDIERLQAETRKIKAETDMIKARTQARLDALQAMVLD
jgi:hypothetical protein